jgi:hypothetical protein
MPEKLFETPVPEQMAIFKSAIADDLREFARRCRIPLNPAPLVNERFDRSTSMTAMAVVRPTGWRISPDPERNIGRHRHAS